MAPFADTFTLFSSLPKELRLQIWGAALNPRVIVLHRNSDRNRARYYFPFGRVAFKIPSFMALTTYDPSLDVIQRVCAESLVFCRRRYMELEVWDLQKNRLGTFYDPHYDVICFSHQVNPMLLQEFAAQYPVETSSMETIALPGRIAPAMFSRTDVLTALHIFENLKEVKIVLGDISRTGSRADTRSDDRHGPRGHGDTWLGGDENSLWTLPHDAERVLERIKIEKWPDWNPPRVTIVNSQEDILHRTATTRVSGTAYELASTPSDSELVPRD
ncbi:hypothetical protein OIDMADRAFT_144430 [Oidiodendron maius Zn]|uniref:2EXR domain-containing protein n=1 Tax=Oidiodendron maius (strain Zn) TaxID=913774 RepID=A0A0C3HHG4_OIDMZ|nr:hypothetical protein OIDMADRAFT_144430 [Oidiodendron maius Zn]